MSTQNQTPAQVQPLDPDTAYALLSQKVYHPAFFEKLAADFNRRPRTEAEALDMLAMAGQLRQAYDQAQEKQAGTSVLTAAKEHLKTELVKRGFHLNQPDQRTNAIKQAAANGARDPQLAHAVLSFHAQPQQQAA